MQARRRGDTLKNVGVKLASFLARDGIRGKFAGGNVTNLGGNLTEFIQKFQIRKNWGVQGYISKAFTKLVI